MFEPKDSEVHADEMNHTIKHRVYLGPLISDHSEGREALEGGDTSLPRTFVQNHSPWDVSVSVFRCEIDVF